MNFYQSILIILSGMVIDKINASVYPYWSNAPLYCKARLAPQGTTLLSSNAPVTQQLAALSNNAVSNWSINQRLGSAGTLQVTLPANLALLSGTLPIEPNGSLVVAGTIGSFLTFHGLLTRYFANATLDTSFGTNGLLYINFPSDGGFTSLSCYCSDGSGGYYVGGYSNHAANQAGIAHVSSSGTIDTGFGTNGYVQPVGLAKVVAVAVQSTGDLVYCASSGANLSLHRLLPTGTVDSSFTIYSSFITGTNTVACTIDSEDRIVVVMTKGADTYVYRINANGGSIDPTFNGGNYYRVTFTQLSAVQTLADNSILVAGNATDDLYVLKLTSTGTPDSSFATNGVFRNIIFPGGGTVGNTISLLPGGNIAIAGSGVPAAGSQRYVVVVLNSNGNFDSYFSIPTQTAPTGPGSAAFQIPAGTASYANLVGYQTSGNNLIVIGSPGDTTFGMQFYVVGG